MLTYPSSSVHLARRGSRVQPTAGQGRGATAAAALLWLAVAGPCLCAARHRGRMMEGEGPESPSLQGKVQLLQAELNSLHKVSCLHVAGRSGLVEWRVRVSPTACAL